MHCASHTEKKHSKTEARKRNIKANNPSDFRVIDLMDLVPAVEVSFIFVFGKCSD